MRALRLFIEMNAGQKYIGDIKGETYLDACFQYCREYLESGDAAAISVSLPLQAEPFSAEKTRSFFEGLLPEGFSRKAVASWIKADENDYLTILSVLGRECLGAIKVVDSDDKNDGYSEYEKLSLEQVKALAEEGATKSTQILMETHLSLTGASGKVGLYYDGDSKDFFLPKGDAPSTHIVKQSHVRLGSIVVNEQLCMLTARNLGLETPDSFIVNTGGTSDADILYATERYDRTFKGGKMLNGLKMPNRLHQEDFAQAMGISAADKYENVDSEYLRRMFDLIRFHCSDPIAEQSKLWKSICFNYLIGNTDCHIKNYALIYSDDLKTVKLAPIYDIVSTRVYNMTKNMSFYIGGKLNIEEIGRDSFEAASRDAGLAGKLAMNAFDQLADSFEGALRDATMQLKEEGFAVAGELQEKILAGGGYGNVG